MGKVIADYWERILFRPVSLRLLTVLRVTTFLFPLYLLASRYFEYLGLVPEDYFWQRIGTKWFSQLVWFQPSPAVIHIVHLLTMAACLSAVCGVAVRQTALVASFGLLFLNNLQQVMTTGDAEVVPYAVAMWLFVVLDPRFHRPLWREFWANDNIDECDRPPAFPFVLLQCLFVSIYFVNGWIKLPYFQQWVYAGAVQDYVYNWNQLTPLIDPLWQPSWTKLLPASMWGAMGAATLFFEVTTPVLLKYRRLIWIWWLPLAGMHLMIWATLTTSFLLFPILFFVSFLPFLFRDEPQGERR